MKKIIRILPIQPSVQQVTLDFERAVWKALRSCQQCSFKAACSTGPRLCGERLVHVKHSFFAAEKNDE